jgi:hypothetical protein
MLHRLLAPQWQRLSEKAKRLAMMADRLLIGPKRSLMEAELAL